MRVLHINCNYLGSALHQTMIEHLDKRGVENWVFVPTYDKNIAVLKINENVTVSECFKKWDRLFFDYKQRKIQRAMEINLDSASFDCIHAYTVFTDGNTAMNLSRKYGIPYVVAVRNTDVNTFFKYMVHLRRRGVEVLKNASAIFFLSEAYRQQILEYYIPKRLKESILKKSWVIPNGIDDFWIENRAALVWDRERDKRLSDRWLRIIYAGKINKNKNIRLTQGALDIMRQQGWKIDFTVIGKVEDQREYEQIISDANTRYMNQQTKEHLISFYRENDIFVMPSHTESFGLVYAEAMSQGLPVVYTKGQGFDGQFAEGQVGFHVDALSKDEVVEAICKIVRNYYEIRNRCVANAEQFTWDAIVKRYDSIYRTLI